MTRAAAAIVVMDLGSRVTCLRALKCLIRALALSAGALIELISSLRHLVSGSGCGVSCDAWSVWCSRAGHRGSRFRRGRSSGGSGSGVALSGCS